MSRGLVALLATLTTGACGFSASGGPSSTVDARVDAVPSDASEPGFDPARCPSSYRAVAGQPYRYLWGPTIVPGALVPWSEAEQRCAATQELGYQPHLVVFETPEERTAVWDVVGPDLNYTWVWTGVYELASGQWAAITGGTITPAWADGEPNLARVGSTQHALGYGSGGGAFGDLDLPYDWYMNLICECDGRDVTALP